MASALDQAMTRLTVEFEWQLAGRIALDPTGALVFPDLPWVPGLYRFWLDSGHERPGVYIGEASDLRRRAQHYRTPGSSQTTNIRLNDLLKSALRAGSVVTLSTITEVTVAVDDEEPRDLPLHRRNARLVAEQAAIAAAAVQNLSDSVDGPPRYPRLLDRPGVGEDEYE